MRYSTLILFLFSLCCFGQDSTLCRFVFPNEGKYEIRVDSSEIYRTNIFSVPPGAHYIEIWNGGMELIYDTIHPAGNLPRVYKYQTKRNLGYLQYRKDLISYRANILGYIVAPFALSVGLSTGTYFVKRRADTQYQDLTDYHGLYDNSTHAEFLTEFPVIYDKKVKKYEASKALFYSSLSLSIVSVAFNAFTIWRFFSKHSKPKNTYFTSPFSKMDYSMNIHQNGAVATMSIRI